MVCVRDPARVRVRGQARGARVHRKEPVQARREVFALDVDFEVASAPRAEPRGRALLVVVVPPREPGLVPRPNGAVP